MTEYIMRRFVPPLGWPINFRAAVIQPAERPKHLIIWNRYPRQVVGIGIRLPDGAGPPHGHYVLSVLWCKPARWWK